MPTISYAYRVGERKDKDDAAMTGSTFGRTARLAALPVSFAGRTTLGVGKRLVGRPAEVVLTEVQQRTAEQIFKVLGELKGGAMKFGQAMSVFEGAMPEELAGPYRQTLQKLQDAAPPMPEELVNRQMTREFSPKWRDNFESFNMKPAAAASIGQVHRGVWFDGRDVAVKIQYPGAERALASDLRQIARASRLFAVVVPGIDIKPLIEELQQRVLEELDYSLEASAQQVFAEEFAGDPHIAVAEVVDFTPRALVSTWLDSPYSLAQVIRDGDQAERDRWATLYARFLFEGPARTGLLHADPHPGNFRVMPDGRLGIVDFGAVARLPNGLPRIMGQLLRAAVENDYDTVLKGLREEGFIKPNSSLTAEVIETYLEPFVAPARVDEFRFDRQWMRQQATRLSAPNTAGLRTAVQLNLPREYLLIHRVWAGGIGVLSQLEATAPFRQMLIDHLPGFAD